MNLKEKYAGKSFAEIAETISKKYKNREIDPVQKRSFETEITALRDMQETYRLKESMKGSMQMGGMLSALDAGKGIAEAFAGALTAPVKFNGGFVDDEEIMLSGQTPLSLNTQNLSAPQFATPLMGTTAKGTAEEVPMIIDPESNTLPTVTMKGKDQSYKRTPLETEAVRTQPTIQTRNESIADKMATSTIASGTMPSEVPFTTREEEEIDYDRPDLVRKERRQLKREYKQDLREAKKREKEETKEPSKIGEFLRSAYGPMGVGKGIEMLGKAAMLAGGYDKFSPNYNPFEQEALNLMRSQGIDTQAVENKILAQQEAAMAGTGNVRSTAVQQALQQGINVNTSDALANAELQQQQMRNQLSSQMANALNVAGQQRVAAEDRATALTSQSKAGYQEGIQNMLEGIGATGQELTEFKQGLISNALTAKLLETENVTINDDCIADYQKGKAISSNCISVRADSDADTGVERESLNQ